MQLVYNHLSYEETSLELHALANEAIEFANSTEEDVSEDKYPNYSFIVELNKQVEKLVGVDEINRQISFVKSGMST